MLQGLQTSKFGWNKIELQHLFPKRGRGYTIFIISTFLRQNFGRSIDLLILKKPIYGFRNSINDQLGYFFEAIRASCIDNSHTRWLLININFSSYPSETSNK